MKFMKFAALALVVTSIVGCASVGNETLRKETEASVQNRIVEGKTTKAQVREAFGSPMKASFTDSGLEVWNYEFSNVSADAISYVPIVNWFGASASGTKKELVVMFDRSNVVQRFTMNESEVKNKTGLFNN